MRQPQLELKPFDRDRLKDVGLRLRQLYPTGDPNIVAQKVTPERITAMVDEVTAGFKGDVGIAPELSPLEACMQLSLFGGTFVRLDEDGVPLAEAGDEERFRHRGKSPWAVGRQGLAGSG